MRMNTKKLLLLAHAALCVLAGALLIAGALGIYRDGAARRTLDPAADIYTAEGVAAAAKRALPAVVLALAAAVACAALGVKDENRIARQAVDRDLRERAGEPERAKTLRLALLLLALGFLVLGVFNGSAHDVFVKASRICTECIGLG